jgi:hypothetical protein
MYVIFLSLKISWSIITKGKKDWIHNYLEMKISIFLKYIFSFLERKKNMLHPYTKVTYEIKKPKNIGNY